MVSEKLQAYRKCMKEGMTGKKFPTVIERRKAFCILTKLCSKKATEEKQAAEMCKEKHPEWFE